MKKNFLSMLTIICVIVMFTVLFNQKNFTDSSVILIVLNVILVSLVFVNTRKKRVSK